MKELFLYNPIVDKYPKGAVAMGSTIKYVVKVAAILNIESINFVYTQDATNTTLQVPMTMSRCKGGYCEYVAQVKFDTVGHYWYHFVVKTSTEQFVLEKTMSFDAQKSYILRNQYMQLIYQKQTSTNTNYQQGVMYHIFVDRFNKSGTVKPKLDAVIREDWGGEVNAHINDPKITNNEFFGGNLKGIIKKLDYLKTLNVTTLYLSPIFESRSNHKYDTADYSKIDSMFGTKKDLQTLIDTAKQKGIGIILDGVFNHTGSDSLYFNKLGTYNTVGAYQSKDSPYYDWYRFSEYPNKYDCWWGVSILPQLNENNESFIEYMTGKNGIVPNYMKMGLLGFRLDVADELSQKFLDELCKSIKQVKQDSIIIGEVWEDASNKIAYSERRQYFFGNELDSVMNYPLKNAIIDYIKNGHTDNLLSCVYMLKDHYPTNVQNSLMNILGTHDTARILTVLGLDKVENASCYRKPNIYLTKKQQNRAVELLKQASLLQYTLMGVPCVYYGDEVGLQGIGDPYNRACYPWGKENTELLAWYQTLGKLRQNPVFVDGETNVLYSENGVFVFERVKGDSRVVVAINKAEQPFEICLKQLHTNYLTNTQTSHYMLHKDQYVILVK